jgi:hydrogenase expression/formation protein HypC
VDTGADSADDLARYGTCTLDQDGCVTCGDLVVPVRVVEVRGNVALCEDRTGRQAEVALEFVPGTARGDVLLVHLGVALACVEEAR